MSLRLGALGLALAAAGWFLWNAFEFLRCGERSCPPGDGLPIRLSSGLELAVLSTYRGRPGEIAVNYLTSHDRSDLGALCAEAKAVWETVGSELSRGGVRKVLLGPTSSDSEFLGMKLLVVPLYTCCVTTPIPVERNRSGEWSFPRCGS